MTVTPDVTDESGEVVEETTDENNGETVRVRIWNTPRSDNDNDDGVVEGNGEPDSVITLTPGEPVVWKDDPEYTAPVLAVDIHPDDAPATVEIYTNPSVHPSEETYGENRVNGAFWNGPINYGVSYDADHEDTPSIIELSGCVLLLATTPPQSL